MFYEWCFTTFYSLSPFSLLPLSVALQPKYLIYVFFATRVFFSLWPKIKRKNRGHCFEHTAHSLINRETGGADVNKEMYFFCFYYLSGKFETLTRLNCASNSVDVRRLEKRRRSEIGPSLRLRLLFSEFNILFFTLTKKSPTLSCRFIAWLLYVYLFFMTRRSVSEGSK